MAYGLIYRTEFTSIGSERYDLLISKKDYTGIYKNVLGAAQPVIHKWKTDDPKASIKGSSLEIRLINENGALPLSNFFSIEDDAFQVQLVHTSSLGVVSTRFIGYLVQDDCTEEVIDYTHEIVLSATDNIGLLKDVSLLEAAALHGDSLISVEDVEVDAGSNIIVLTDYTSSIQAGDTIIVSGTGGVIDGTHYVYATSSLFIGGGKRLFTNTTFANAYSGTATFTSITPVDLTVKLPLTEFFRLALRSTGLELNTRVFSRLFEVNSAGLRFMELTYLNGETFLDGETWKSCYDVVNIILTKFQATLFQSNGEWNIIRQDERRYYNNSITGFFYNDEFVYVSEVVLDDDFIIGIDEDSFAEFGLTKSILRPYKFVKETFNYKQPSNLLRNADFQKLGNLRTSYTNPADPTQTFYEYDMADWDLGFTWTLGGGSLLMATNERFIRILKDSLGEELDRYGVIEGDEFPNSATAATSKPIELSAGDSVKISFDFKTTDSISGPATTAFDFALVTTFALTPLGANYRWLREGKWSTLRATPYSIFGGDNFNEWHTFDMTSEPSPYDGKLYIRLAQIAMDDTETHYKNLRLEIVNAINGTTKIIGHTHTDTQAPVIKNSYDEEIFIDDSPRNSINGTLFLPSFNGPLQARTTLWNVGTTMFTDMKLGNLTTRDNLYWRRLPRTKLEGNIYGLMQDNHVSMLTNFRHTHSSMSDLNFIPGMMSIDYANDNFSGTLYEMFKDSEYTIGTITFDELTEVYEFKYLFEKQ